MLDTYWDLVQNQGRFALDGYVRFTEQSAKPGGLLVGSGHWNLYGKSGGLYYEDDNGTETGPLGAPITDHGGLGGLADDDHTGYALLAGRGTSQTLNGGLSSGNNLILVSSAHATKGGIGLGATPSSIHGSIVADYVQVKKVSGGGNLQIVGTVTGSGTALAELDFGSSGYSASDKRGALINVAADAAGTTNPTSRMEFYVNNAGSFVQALTIKSDGKIGIGAAAPEQLLHIAGANNSEVLLDGLVTAFSPTFMGRGFRNTLASPSAVQTNDTLAHFTGAGRAATAYVAGKASIVMSAGENWTDSIQGAYIMFQTTPLGSTTRAERFRIGPSGQFGIGGATYGSAGAYMRSAGASAPPVWSTLILPNAATANRIVYASAADTYGESANLAYDGTDFLLGSGTRARMDSQNRFRHLNSMARAYLITTNQTISNNTRTILLLNAEEFDTDTIHDTVTNSGRLTAKLAGKYIASASVRWASNATGDRLISIKKNGTTLVSENGNDSVDGNGVLITGSPVIVSLAANDYLEVEVFQDSGGNLDVVVDDRTQFSMAYLGE
jgi:hypothetical protein